MKAKCPKCGSNETLVIKEEKFPVGGGKRIIRCKKCGTIFEEEGGW